MQYPKELIAETCLVTLTAISYILPRRADLVPFFEKTLKTNLEKIISQNSLILRVRMSLLLGYYADMLFKSYPEEFLSIIYFLINSLNYTGD